MSMCECEMCLDQCRKANVNTTSGLIIKLITFQFFYLFVQKGIGEMKHVVFF